MGYYQEFFHSFLRRIWIQKYVARTLRILWRWGRNGFTLKSVLKVVVKVEVAFLRSSGLSQILNEIDPRKFSGPSTSSHFGPPTFPSNRPGLPRCVKKTTFSHDWNHQKTFQTTITGSLPSGDFTMQSTCDSKPGQWTTKTSNIPLNKSPYVIWVTKMIDFQGTIVIQKACGQQATNQFIKN